MNIKLFIVRSLLLILIIFTLMEFCRIILYKQSFLKRGPVIVIDGGNCTRISITELYLFGRNNRFQNGIPRIVHYNYKSNRIPLQYVDLVKRCVAINPGVIFVLWSDASSLHLVSTQFPSYLDVYQSYLHTNSHPLKKSDVIRYLILLKFGGIYMDLDTHCQRAMSVAMARGSCVLSREAEVQTRVKWNYQFYAMNSFMACVSNHSFFNYIAGNLHKDDSTDILTKTGPLFMTKLFERYISTLNSTEKEDTYKDISVASSDSFSPFIEPDLEKYCIRPVGVWNIIGCRDLPGYRKVENEKKAEAVVVHLFYHLGYKFAANLIKDVRDICSIEGLNLVV